MQEYERAVIFRLGRLMSGGAKGPGTKTLICNGKFVFLMGFPNVVKIQLRKLLRFIIVYLCLRKFILLIPLALTVH